MEILEFYKFLNNEINLTEFEKWIYKNDNLVGILDEECYQTLLEFNYNKKMAELEIQNFIFKNIITEIEFSQWKVNKLFESINIEFPDTNIYHYAKQNPYFLGGKTLKFNNYWNKEVVEIFWIKKVSQFFRNTSEKRKDNEKYLYFGTYDNTYIHLVANQKGEIWLAYDVLDKEDFWANNLKEAVAKLFIQKH